MRFLLLALLVTALAAPAAAQAATPLTIIKDCMQDGRLDRDYSNADLRRAKRELTGDQLEYYDCLEVLNAAINNPDAPGGGGGDGGEQGGAPAPRAASEHTAADSQALKEATGEAAEEEPPARTSRTPAPAEAQLVGATSDPPNGPSAPVLALLAAAVLVGLAAGILRGLGPTSQPPGR